MLSKIDRLSQKLVKRWETYNQLLHYILQLHSGFTRFHKLANHKSEWSSIRRDWVAIWNIQYPFLALRLTLVPEEDYNISYRSTHISGLWSVLSTTLGCYNLPVCKLQNNISFCFITPFSCKNMWILTVQL